MKGSEDDNHKVGTAGLRKDKQFSLVRDFPEPVIVNV